MGAQDQQGKLLNQFLLGAIDRRTFVRRAAAVGLSAGTLATTLQSASAIAAQDAPSLEPTVSRPDGTPVDDEQQVLRMVTPSPFRMDPLTYSGDLWQLQMIVYQGLTRVDVNGEIIGGIADTWESSEDGTSWTFHLNPDAAFSDGTPITAEDVAWSWNWLVNPESLSTTADVTAGRVVGYDAVRNGEADALEGIVIEDEHTITFNLTAPTPAFPAIAGTTGSMILKRDNVLEGGEEWWREPITSGFFKVTEYTPGDQATMTLERNEHWWREPAKLRQIFMELVPDPQTQLVMYDNGEIDGMVCQPAEFAQATQPDGPRSEDLFWDTAVATWYFGYFIEKPPFEDVKVRQALAHAIDMDAVSMAALNGIYPPQRRNIPAGFPCGGDEQWQPAFDPERAQQLLAESSYADNLPPITIVVSEQGGATALGTWGRVASVIQQQLDQNLGVQVELVRQTFETAEAQIEFLRSLDGGAIYRLSYGVSVQDPSFVSNVALSTSSGNRTGYNNPEVDELVAQADSELDHDRRCELYAEIDRIISEEAMFMAPFRGTSTWFFRPEVRGMRVTMGRIWHSIHQMYIAEEE